MEIRDPAPVLKQLQTTKKAHDRQVFTTNWDVCYELELRGDQRTYRKFESRNQIEKKNVCCEEEGNDSGKG